MSCHSAWSEGPAQKLNRARSLFAYRGGGWGSVEEKRINAHAMGFSFISWPLQKRVKTRVCVAWTMVTSLAGTQA